MERRLLGIDELSEFLGIRSQTIRKRLSGGTFPIPAKKVCGRVKFDRRDVEKYLDRLKPSYARCDYREAGGVDSKGRI